MQKHTNIDTKRFNAAKASFTTRRVPVSEMKSVRLEGWSPKSGDVMLARVEEVGHHQKIELRHSRLAQLYPGDEIIIACGNRYATDQFEAVLQNGLLPTDMVAAGGIASNLLSAHSRMKSPTRLKPVGAICNAQGHVINLKDFMLPTVLHKKPITTIFVVGTSMNSGKTTTAASLVHGLSKQGYKVGAAKVTGTGAGGDPWLMHDSGASVVYDFTDGGYASTYLVPLNELEDLTHRLIDQLAFEQCDVAVVEIADGIQHFETSHLLSCNSIKLRTHGVLFAAYDAMGAMQGVRTLRQERYNILGLSGMITCSPLARQEIQKAVGMKTLTPQDLQEGAIAEQIVFGAQNMAEVI